MMNKLKNLLIKNYPLLVIFLFNLVVFNFSLRFRLSVDDYVLISDPEEIMAQASSLGRPIMTFVIKLLGRLNISLVFNQDLFMLITILLFSISIYILASTLKEQLKTSIYIAIAISWLIILNIFSAELFYFNLGNIFFSISILCVTIAFKLLVDYKSKLIIAISIILLTISLFSYQTWAHLIIPLYLTVTGKILNLKFLKDSKFYTFLLSYLAAFIIDAAYIFLFHPLVFPDKLASRTQNIDWLENLKTIWNSFDKVFLTNFNLTFPYVIAIITSLVLVLVLLNKPRDIKSILSRVLEISILFLSIALPTYGLILLTKGAWIVPRTVIVIGSLLPLLIVYFYKQNFNITKLIGTYLLPSILLILIAITSITHLRVSSDQLTVNYLDKKYAESILFEIEEYEKSNNNEIKTITFYFDKYPSYSYPNILFYGDMNIKAFIAEFSQVRILNYYSNRSFQRVKEKKDSIDNFAKNINWDSFSKEQLLFDGIHLDIIVY